MSRIKFLFAPPALISLRVAPTYLFRHFSIGYKTGKQFGEHSGDRSLIVLILLLHVSPPAPAAGAGGETCSSRACIRAKCRAVPLFAAEIHVFNNYKNSTIAPTKSCVAQNVDWPYHPLNIRHVAMPRRASRAKLLLFDRRN